MDNITQPDSRIVEDKGAMRKFLLRRYLIAIAFAILMFFTIALINGTFEGYQSNVNPEIYNETSWIMRKLSDTFIVDGVLFICCAGFVVCSRSGAYDGLAFGVRQALGVMFKKPENMKYKDLYEYKKAQEGKRPEYRYMLWIGLVTFAIGLVFLALYYVTNVKP